MISFVKAFRTPKESLGDFDAEQAAQLIAAASDIALVIDSDGTILDAAFQRIELPLELRDTDQWLGRSWQATVVEDSQPKIEALLQEASSRTVSRGREVRYAGTRGPDIPIVYTAVAAGSSGRTIAIGRDMRATVALQQKLIEAQLAIERDYSRIRNVETRYRILFQTSSEPVLIVDAATHRIVETNAAAAALGDNHAGLIGKLFPDQVLLDDMAASQIIAQAVRTQNRVDDLKVRFEGGRAFLLTGLFFRQDASSFFLFRFAPAGETPRTISTRPDVNAQLLRFVDDGPDAFVLTDSEGRLLKANATFLQIAQVETEKEILGETIDRWIGNSGVEFNVLLSNLRQHKLIKLFASVVRGELGSEVDVEISATALDTDEGPHFGFAIRSVGQRIQTERPAQSALPRSVDQLSELIGRVPLREIVRETTDVIERLCIEASLKLTGDNRASAAELLGLSRQSLYVKLRRFGIADAADTFGDTSG